MGDIVDNSGNLAIFAKMEKLMNDKPRQSQEGVFMNLMSDFAFKRIFGTKERKHLLIRFLNIIFEKEALRVDDVEYLDKEVLPNDDNGKRILYDVYCTINGHSEHVILEMQQLYHQYFEDRTVYYAAKAIASQGTKGWNYELKPVYSIFIVDFAFNHLDRQQIHDVRLIDSLSHKIYTNAIRLIFLHLSEAKTSWEECRTDFDKILFIIKNMYKMDKESKAYKSGEFYDFFKESEVQSLAAEDAVAYSQSNLRYWENQQAVEYASRKGRVEGWYEGEKEGRKVGIREGIKEGIKEGRNEERAKIAMNLKLAGVSADLIASTTGLTLKEIADLRQDD